MTKKIEKTEIITLEGTAQWAKPYKPDEFRGSVRWTLRLGMDDENTNKYKNYGLQKKLVAEDGMQWWNPQRLTSKKIKNDVVYFTPPFIFDKDGESLVKYVNDAGKPVYSYTDPNTKITRVGDPVLIGNGSKVEIKLSVYPTDMGNGNRLEAIRILDLITYEPSENDGTGSAEVTW